MRPRFGSLLLIALALRMLFPPAITFGLAPADSSPPAAPTDLRATRTEYDYIALAWAPNSEPDLDHYEIYRERWCGVGVGFWYFLDRVAGANWYVDLKVLRECVYAYYVIAVDTSGNQSPHSNYLWTESFPDGRSRMYLPLLVGASR